MAMYDKPIITDLFSCNIMNYQVWVAVISLSARLIT